MSFFWENLDEFLIFLENYDGHHPRRDRRRTSLLFGTSDLTYLAPAVVVAQLPDLDFNESELGQSLWWPWPW